MTALVTPFKNGKLDERAFQDMVERQIEAGTHGLVPTGTTGEAPCLIKDEHVRVIELAVEAAQGRVLVIPGCGSNSTAQTLDLVSRSQKLDIDGLLIVCPYYNRPSQEGLFQHFEAIAKATDLPIIIYNIPGRTGVDMTTETMARLYETFNNIAGVKDATGSVARIEESSRVLGRDFIQLSGDDILTLDFMKKGGQGCISVTANISPGLCAEFQTLCLKGDFSKASKIHSRLTPLHKGLFVETNPVPVKYAASLMGLCTPEVRLPLAPLAEESKKVVEKALFDAGVEF